ncbi:conserved hypothetical protein [Theileria orientalis strain Shintoku]|uniref:Uncharacterized protein n=1 Tax=Theileria orientalis strain Shintoku TaxID=869250 RepID=J7M837_THEOR|nr:conserved hypothetical protein [Theileria orientalis strain Shintoku]BAM38598.1 conserved hypothetical protein [Theileria orientalis strain Shintoku]|eukprot:XP_009688899.1 conserved hypothetical protein [Theileria orientalis strain Shintoku]
MSTAPGLSFANVTLLLDVPQLPAIVASNCFHNYRTLSREFRFVINEAEDLVYPFNRINLQDRNTNRMGRPRKYNDSE